MKPWGRVANGDELKTSNDNGYGNNDKQRPQLSNSVSLASNTICKDSSTANDIHRKLANEREENLNYEQLSVATLRRPSAWSEMSLGLQRDAPRLDRNTHRGPGRPEDA
jgi:hypothetical protein